MIHCFDKYCPGVTANSGCLVTRGPALCSYNRTYITQLYQDLYFPVTTEPTLAILQQTVSKFCKFIFFPEAVFDHNH